MPRFLPALLFCALLGTACGEATFSPPAGEPTATRGAAVPASAVAATTPGGETVVSPTAEPRLAPPATAPGGAAAVSPGNVVSLGLPAPPVQMAAGILVDAATGEVLWEQNSGQRLPPASLTKIATAAVALELLPDTSRVLDTSADPVQEWLEDASTMGLQPGDRFSVKELLYGLMMASGNDAAKELARAASGSEQAFVSQMNALARRLGMANTRFSDVHGLGGPEHYTTARDLAVLARYAMTLPEFREVVGTESRTAVGSRPIELYNHNPLLNYTPGVTGIKTGFTEDAGNTFAVSVQRDGNGIILVMLNAPNMAFDAIDMIEWAYANFSWS